MMVSKASSSTVPIASSPTIRPIGCTVVLCGLPACERQRSLRLAFEDFAALIDSDAAGRLKFQIQVIAGMAQLSGPHECAVLDEVGKVARGRGRGSAGDLAVVAGAEATFETLLALAQHAKNGHALALIDLAAEAVDQARFFDQEVD